MAGDDPCDSAGAICKEDVLWWAAPIGADFHALLESLGECEMDDVQVDQFGFEGGPFAHERASLVIVIGDDAPAGFFELEWFKALAADVDAFGDELEVFPALWCAVLVGVFRVDVDDDEVLVVAHCVSKAPCEVAVGADDDAGGSGQ